MISEEYLQSSILALIVAMYLYLIAVTIFERPKRPPFANS